ncbi:hypothetical protein MRS44_017176 [Fusarium solani]|uniref:uncharacterized protein n=1 Tax=Fusarium solani TaxID=169388 RepID=UPI0032C401EF|nr:hypothetical protein MRS44_017176 [Fusarium solani]
MQRNNHTFLAGLCGQAERYEDMVPHLKAVVNIGGELSVNERNLLAIAYKNVVDTRRASWRIIYSIEQKESRGNEKYIATICGYRIKIENELEMVCQDVLDLLDRSLIPNTGSDESKAFYYKMSAYFTGLSFLKAPGLTRYLFRKGDYSRYLAEFASGEKRNFAITSAYKAYKIAVDIAQTELTATHLLRLGLALNFSVFYYEILNSRDGARYLAKHALDNGIAELDALTEESNSGSILIMHLLYANLTLWMSSDSGELEPPSS